MSTQRDMRNSSQYKEATRTIISSDVLVMKVSVGTPQDSSIDCYCYFDDLEQEYFLCGGSRHGRDMNSEVFKYFCKTRKSLLSMLDSILEQGRCLELKLVNFPNLFVENEHIDFNLLDSKFKKFGFGTVSSVVSSDFSVTYDIDDDYNRVLCPSVITHLYYDNYTDNTYSIMKKYAKLLKNVRW
jgi:hypothetical protein